MPDSEGGELLCPSLIALLLCICSASEMDNAVRTPVLGFHTSVSMSVYAVLKPHKLHTLLLESNEWRLATSNGHLATI